MSRTWDVAIVGAGYVGLPLAQTFADAGKRVLLIDAIPEIVDGINAGRSHIEDVSSEALDAHVSTGRITATLDYEQLRQAEAILIALPLLRERCREPDLGYVEREPPARSGRGARVHHVPRDDA